MITDKIKKALNLEVLPEKQDPRWTMFDDGGVETEVGDFLYGLVRANKPKRILESGTYSGISSMYMGLALQKNGEGTLETIEFEQVHAERSKKRFIKLGIQDIVKITLSDSLKFEPQGMYDMLFLDTEPNIRYKELVKFYPYLSEGGYAFIHDLPNTFCYGHTNPDHPEIEAWPFGTVPKEMKDLDLSIFNVGSARGLAGFYKPNKNDWRNK